MRCYLRAVCPSLIKPWRSATVLTRKKVDALLARMTLDEKIGQLNQYNGDWEVTGPVTKSVGNKIDEIKQGRVGAVLNIMGTDHTRTFQDAAMQSRLKIPLLFGQDVIHGYRITFPIPLAEAASWNMDMIEKSERIAATEASASGINWTFAPMVDIARAIRALGRIDGRRRRRPLSRFADRDSKSKRFPGKRPGQHRCGDGLCQAFCRLWRRYRRARL